MALKYADRVKETTEVALTASIVMLGATAGYRTFSSQLANGDTCYYSIVDPTTNEWEIGLGTFSSSTNSLSRNPISSSYNNNPVSFGSGVKDVFITYPSNAIQSLLDDVITNSEEIDNKANLSGATFTGTVEILDTDATTSFNYSSNVQEGQSSSFLFTPTQLHIAQSYDYQAQGIDLYLGRLKFFGLPTYASNVEAIAGGLATDQLYKTPTGQVMTVMYIAPEE